MTADHTSFPLTMIWTCHYSPGARPGDFSPRPPVQFDARRRATQPFPSTQRARDKAPCLPLWHAKQPSPRDRDPAASRRWRHGMVSRWPDFLEASAGFPQPANSRRAQKYAKYRVKCKTPRKWSCVNHAPRLWLPCRCVKLNVDGNPRIAAWPPRGFTPVSIRVHPWLKFF